jgi:hypothetical protein
MQVLAPYINSGARHVFPVGTGTPLNFNIVVKEKFIVRSPSPLEGNRVGSLSNPVHFGKALKALKKGNKSPKKGNKSPGKGSDTGSSGSRSGGTTRKRKCTLRRMRK